jgi:hypothetical protein
MNIPDWNHETWNLSGTSSRTVANPTFHHPKGYTLFGKEAELTVVVNLHN